MFGKMANSAIFLSANATFFSPTANWRSVSIRPMYIQKQTHHDMQAAVILAIPIIILIVRRGFNGYMRGSNATNTVWFPSITLAELLRCIVALLL